MGLTLQPIAGAYYMTYAGVYVGATEDGFEIEHNYYSEPVRGDNLGDAIQNEIYRGVDVTINTTLIEYGIAKPVTADAGNVYWPSHATEGTNGVIGDVHTDQGGATVLTRADANTAATPATMTFAETRLATNFPVRIQLANRLKRIPIRLQVYPHNAASSGFTASYNASTVWYS